MNILITKQQIREHLIDIEAKLPKRAYSLYQPAINFLSFDVIAIQNEAKKMMEFIGLYGFTTLVTFDVLNDHTGGNINLNDKKEVFININSDYRNSPSLCLAVLAHEICHKLLYVYGLYYPSFDDLNEVYADLATFFVGFGALTLNGCQVDNHRVGYLNLSDYAYAYYVVNESREINYDDYGKPIHGSASGLLYT